LQKENSANNISRRGFISLIPVALIGSKSLLSQSEKQDSVSLPVKLTEDDKEKIKNSIMAKNLNNYFGRGYSCAESGLLVGLDYLEKPKDLVCFACGFGGGILHRDLCGFLTSGIMVLGLASSKLKSSRSSGKSWCRARVNEFWDWWKTRAPLHCSQIRTPGRGGSVCKNLGMLSAAKIETFIKSSN